MALRLGLEIYNSFIPKALLGPAQVGMVRAMAWLGSRQEFLTRQINASLQAKIEKSIWKSKKTFKNI